MRLFPLAAILTIALGLRLVVWRWYEFYPLSGDEQEYLNQALTLLRTWRYDELRLMRPPLYGFFLAACIVLVDSLVQNLRLVQALISAATVVPMYALTREIAHCTLHIADEHRQASSVKRQASMLAALLCALSYTLAANATELLTETLFLFGLTTFFWLLLRAARLTGSAPQTGLAGRVPAVPAGLTLGLLCLTRSTALPLLPLGVLWLMINARGGTQKRQWRIAIVPALLFTCACCALVLPWTVRNALTYGAPIIIDTTGAENLWLDNDPAGREAVKAQLYALGGDMAARQRLATQQGLAAITSDPQRFAAKAWGELLKFFALEYADTMRDKPAIWVPPTQVWARLLLGDALWLFVLLAGTYGLTRLTITSRGVNRQSSSVNPAVLFILWALYTLLTAMLFHVELRYRLPLYPLLLPYAALALSSLRAPLGNAPPTRAVRLLGFIPPLLCLLLTLAYRPYPVLAWHLGWKHIALARAEQAATRGDAAATRAAAQDALANDARSVLARVALARAALLEGDQASAEALLREATTLLPAHPHAHLLLGDLARLRDEQEAARQELRYENNSLEDLQRWSWQRFRTPPPARLDLGDGLDLGFIQGFHVVQAGEEGWRWTKGTALLRLAAPPAAAQLRLRLASGRPEGQAPTPLDVLINGTPAGRLDITRGWNDYRLPVPAAQAGQTALEISLRSPTFTPREFDRSSPDGRSLGIMVDQAAIEATAAE